MPIRYNPSWIKQSMGWCTILLKQTKTYSLREFHCPKPAESHLEQVDQSLIGLCLQDSPFLSECKLGSNRLRVRQSSQRALLDRIPRLFQVCSISLGWTQASDLSGFSCPFCLPCFHYELKDLITIKNKQEKTSIPSYMHKFDTLCFVFKTFTLSFPCNSPNIWLHTYIRTPPALWNKLCKHFKFFPVMLFYRYR